MLSSFTLLELFIRSISPNNEWETLVVWLSVSYLWTLLWLWFPTIRYLIEFVESIGQCVFLSIMNSDCMANQHCGYNGRCPRQGYFYLFILPIMLSYSIISEKWFATKKKERGLVSVNVSCHSVLLPFSILKIGILCKIYRSKFSIEVIRKTIMMNAKKRQYTLARTRKGLMLPSK